MDLEDKELEATRRLNGVARESNIEIIEDFINEIKDFELNKDTVEIVNALEDILAEREEDKKKIKELETKQKAMCEEYCPKTERIKELEVLEDDLKDKRIVYIDTPEFEKEFIPKQKVKDYLKEEKERFEVYKRESKENESLKLGMWRHLGAKNMCEKILGIERIATLD